MPCCHPRMRFRHFRGRPYTNGQILLLKPGKNLVSFRTAHDSKMVIAQCTRHKGTAIIPSFPSHWTSLLYHTSWNKKLSQSHRNPINTIEEKLVNYVIDRVVEVRSDWVPALPLTSCVTCSPSLRFAEISLPHWQKENNTSSYLTGPQ